MFFLPDMCMHEVTSRRPRQGDRDQKYCLQESGPSLRHNQTCPLLDLRLETSNASEVENMYSLKTQKARQFISEACTAWARIGDSRMNTDQDSKCHAWVMSDFWRCRSASLCCPSVYAQSRMSRLGVASCAHSWCVSHCVSTDSFASFAFGVLEWLTPEGGKSGCLRGQTTRTSRGVGPSGCRKIKQKTGQRQFCSACYFISNTRYPVLKEANNAFWLR